MSPAAVKKPLQKREHTREELRRCALARFARDGFEATKVAEVAADAGVTERTFYRHFPTKESVLFEDFASRLGWFRRALALRHPDEPILDAVRVAVESFPDDREVVRQVAQLRSSLLSSAVIDDQLRRIQADFAREVERYAVPRLSESPDPQLAAAVLGSAVAAALVASVRVWGERDGRDTDALREQTARALDLLRQPPVVLTGESTPAS
jgi:AcrR family transcriptional regulator